MIIYKYILADLVEILFVAVVEEEG